MSRSRSTARPIPAPARGPRNQTTTRPPSKVQHDEDTGPIPELPPGKKVATPPEGSGAPAPQRAEKR